MNERSKYYPLFSHLQQSSQSELVLSLADIEMLLGAKLPKTARIQRAWWSNRSQGAVQAAAWMEAGFHVAAVDFAAEQVTFRKPGVVYHVRRRQGQLLWDAELVKALRHYMGLTQAEFAEELGVRQPTVSEWETGAYEPKRSTSKLLSFVAERAGFEYGVE